MLLYLQHGFWMSGWCFGKMFEYYLICSYVFHGRKMITATPFPEIMLSHICPDRQDGDKSQEYRNQIHKVLMHNILKWLQKQWITKSPKSKVWQMNMSKLAT